MTRRIAMRAALLAVLLGAALRFGGPAVAQPRDCGPVAHGSLRPGEIVRGRIDDCVPSESWTFDGVEGQAVMISMEQTLPPSFATVELDPVLRLFGPSDSGEETMAAGNDDGGYGLNARIQFILSRTGRHRIVASSIAGSAGDFQLWYTFVGRGATDRGPIRSGDSFSGLIDASNPEDAWTFEGRAGQRVLIAMRRTRPLSLDNLFFDPLLFLMRVDENGVEVVEEINDDAQDELDALILTRLERSGRYRIIATRIGDTFGRYTLNFELGEPDR